MSVGCQEKVLEVFAHTDNKEATEQSRMKCLTDVLLNQATPVPEAEWASPSRIAAAAAALAGWEACCPEGPLVVVVVVAVVEMGAGPGPVDDW